MTRWMAYIRQSLRAIWFRASIFTLAGIVLAIIAHPLSWIIPPNMSFVFGQRAAASILQILATSMLAVTTFSLTTMVSAYASATQTGTPRSTQLLIADRTSQNALSTFVGAFAFSIVGIVALSMEVYSESGRAVLFLGTILVITAVLVTLLRWISFLASFGRMADIIDRVEAAATRAMRAYIQNPLLGGRPWVQPPGDVHAISSDQTGFVVQVDIAALQNLAKEENCQIWVARRPGSRLYSQQPLIFLDAALSQASQDAVRRAFVVAAHRTFDRDPRLGLIALSEISSRALSPAVNDPGTAIEVLNALHTVLKIALETPDQFPSPEYPLVHVRQLDPQDLLEDAFRAISRDGASTIEVMMRVQKELGALLLSADDSWAPALRAQAIDSFHRATQGLDSEADIREVTRLHTRAISRQLFDVEAIADN